MDKAQRDALEGVGLSPKEMTVYVEKGDVMGAIRKISAKLSDASISEIKKQKIVADIFNSSGEDAGRSWLESLADVKMKLTEVTDKTTDWKKNSNEFELVDG